MPSLFKAGLLLCVATFLAIIALLMPAHLRSVDENVLKYAGAHPDAIENKLWEEINAAYVGPAQLFIQATGYETPSQQGQIQQLLNENPLFKVSGGPDRDFEDLLRTNFQPHRKYSVISVLLHGPKRQLLSEQLNLSRNRNVRALLDIRNLNGLTRLHPNGHPAGAPYDAGVLTLALLIEGGHFKSGVSQQIGNLAVLAKDNDAKATIACEDLVIGTLSLGHQLDYCSLASLAKLTKKLSDWSQMAALFRAQPDQIAELYTALRFSETPQALHAYLEKHKETGIQDLKFALRQGPKAVAYLVESEKPIYRASPIAAKLLDTIAAYRPRSFATICYQQNFLGQLIKFTLLIFSGFAFALALLHVGHRYHGYKTVASRISPVTITRDLLISCIFAFTIWIFLEPDILKSPKKPPQNNPQIEFAIADTLHSLKSPIKAMQELNQVTLLVLAIFFILQLIIYSFCLIKLREIRKQAHASKIKLRLLDNEENLFDFGLYVGLGGTVLSLILVAIGIVEASLMAAYASTLFGILFTATLKVLHVRPYRRKLILESDSYIGQDIPEKSLLDHE